MGEAPQRRRELLRQPVKAHLLYLDGRIEKVELRGNYHLKIETPERQVRTAKTFFYRPSSWCCMFGPLKKDENGDYVYHEAAYFREDMTVPSPRKL